MNYLFSIRLKHCGKFFLRCLAAVVIISAVLPFQSQAAEIITLNNLENSPDTVDRAVWRGVKFLVSQIRPDGTCSGESVELAGRKGYQTALCLYALLSAGVDDETPAVKRALQWLANAELSSTVPLAMRVCALSQCNSEQFKAQLKKDTSHLVEMCDANGAYSSGQAGGVYDNTSSQLAVMGVLSAMNRGIKVPRDYWARVRGHWLDQQQIDGGWAYRIRPGEMTAESYGSITANGLATLLICNQQLDRDNYIRCKITDDPAPVTNAVKWITEHFSSASNPRKGIQWYYSWVFGLSRIASQTGQKYIAGNDWFDKCAREVLENQSDDGGWGYGRPEQRIEQSALAVLFLSRSRYPLWANKLQYNGKWNCRPYDAKNTADFLGNTFENSVGWQIVSADCRLGDLNEAPILYISGAGPIRLEPQQIDVIRQYVWQGGMILSEAAGNNGSFTLDMQELYAKLFENYPLERLADDHPIYSEYFTVKKIGGLMGVSNSVRLLAMHCPREISLAMHMGVSDNYRPQFDLLANIFLSTTDKGKLRQRGFTPLEEKRPFTPEKTYRVARIKYDGNWNPEPLAWERFANISANRFSIDINYSAGMDFTELNADQYPAAFMCGTSPFTLSQQQKDAIGKYLQNGGLLICDAAGGSEPFTRSVERHIVPLVGTGRRRILASDVGLSGPAGITKVDYRRKLSQVMGAEKNVPQLRGVFIDNRLAMIYSPMDITAGLAGIEGFTIKGYTPKSACEIMINLLDKSK